jgi:RHS repeat-associated protein
VEGIGGILYTLRNGVPSYTHYNSRGDVTAKTDDTSKVTYQALYEAYGKRTVETGSTLDRQKANTKDEDPTGLLNEGMRYRDLDTGIFLSRDPLGFKAGTNMYTYVLDNPWTHFDPEGLDIEITNPVAVTILNAITNVVQNTNVQNIVNGLSAGEVGATEKVIANAPKEVEAAKDALKGTEKTLENLAKKGEEGAKDAQAAKGGEAGKGGETGKGSSTPGTSQKQTTDDAQKTVTRYMGKEEADTAKNTGEIPNKGVDGKERPTHVTTDKPTDSASEAKQKYELPSDPTHRATVPSDRVKDLGPTPDQRPTTSGGGTQHATNKPIPVKPEEIVPLSN